MLSTDRLLCSCFVRSIINTNKQRTEIKISNFQFLISNERGLCMISKVEQANLEKIS